MSRTPGSPKTGGRQKGSLDRQARALVSAELAGNILTVFRAMGGTMAMLKWAESNQTVFYTQILSRLMPAPPKEDPDAVNNTQINIGNMSDLDAAMRIAFALEKGLRAAREQQPSVIEADPDE